MQIPILLLGRIWRKCFNDFVETVLDNVSYKLCDFLV